MESSFDDILLDENLEELALSAIEFAELPNDEAQVIYKNAKEKFVQGNPRVWWLGLKTKAKSLPTDDTADMSFLRQNWPEGEESCYFIPEGMAEPRVFLGTLEGIIKVLLNQNGFIEYNLVGRNFDWLMIETDHNELLVIKP